ncbi:MAG: hypothetical protein ABSF26_19725 [Thermoguttaceae bacterium]
MTTHSTTQANAKKMVQLKAALSELLEQVLRRGFFGTAAVRLTLQDGTIQQIRCMVDRLEK